MKDKNLAAVLAFFGGIMGLHRFYLGQVGLGILYIIFAPLAWLIGVIDAISFLSMDQQTFDAKYNKSQYHPVQPQLRNQNARPMNDREARYQQRQRDRAIREQQLRQKRNGRRASETGPSPQPVRAVSTGQAEREAGLKYFRDFEYDRAILAFQQALEKNPRDVASHFNIACSYSCEEEADKAFYHLDRAVAMGFADFERIRTHDSLAFLRVQPNFEAFVANGYRLAPDRSEEEVVLANPIKEEEMVELPQISEDLLEQLQRLATLKEKGLLTENEFATQKKRLLG
ncbi:NINE protein [Neolewinella lacunae]|uniref:NINE protein n=1 Tax=Neolewinella lacunae TaxID=1517758 RepID=A0A923PNU9_9BACT|nr:NINE protein [Neolewinella lacunae]MBC6995855.1 NINE protein [Neolewinella lacunae]MDN3636452.1 NINE protein [Neolewinella lacunae]